MDGRKWNTGSQPPAAPVQQPNSPFEEPEQAPELRQSRSENLYTRDEPFWNRVEGAPQTGQPPVQDANYWNHPDVMASDTLLHVESDTRMKKMVKYLGSSPGKRLLLILAIILIVGVLLYSNAFRLSRITVLGNTTVPGQDIVRLSGLKIGQNTLQIDDEAVMHRIEANRYLRCQLVDVQWRYVTIHVKERVPAAYVNHNGMSIMMDNRGFVLEESLDPGTAWDHLVKIIGMDVRRSALGQTITLNSTLQRDTYTQVLVELKAMNGLHLLRELDMSSMDSIYLATSDQPFSSLETEAQKANRKIIYARLGSEDSIHEKLRAFMITRERVIDMGYSAGTIDVTDPGRPTFSPK